MATLADSARGMAVVLQAGAKKQVEQVVGKAQRLTILGVLLAIAGVGMFVAAGLTAFFVFEEWTHSKSAAAGCLFGAYAGVAALAIIGYKLSDRKNPNL